MEKPIALVVVASLAGLLLSGLADNATIADTDVPDNEVASGVDRPADTVLVGSC